MAIPAAQLGTKCSAPQAALEAWRWQKIEENFFYMTTLCAVAWSRRPNTEPDSEEEGEDLWAVMRKMPRLFFPFMNSSELHGITECSVLVKTKHYF